MGPEIRFASHGQQRIRVQTREDGVSIDQIVISASRYFTSSPGALKNDTTILQESPADIPATNQPPTVTLTAPSSSTEFTAPATISVTAEAGDTDGAIQRVEFFAGITAIGTASSAPYAIQWADVPAGTYILTARAVDEDGSAATSTPLTITVVAPSSSPLNCPWRPSGSRIAKAPICRGGGRARR